MKRLKIQSNIFKIRMTRILTIGDPHFKENNLDEMSLFIQKITTLAIEQKPDLIVVLGDVLDTHEKINIYALTESDKLHRQLLKIAQVVIIVGNHDRVDNQDFLSEYHAFNSYKETKNVLIVDSVKELTINGNRFLFVPYVYPGRFEEALNTINDPLKCTAIFAHQEFYGAQMGAIKSEIGDKWDQKFPLIISGHIHDYQRIQNNIIYTGTPVQHTFGNEKKKTVSIYTFDSSNSGELKWKEERFSLGLPKKRKITIESNEIIDWICPSNTKVKLVIMGTLEEIKSVKKLKKINKLKSDGILIKYIIKHINQEPIVFSSIKKTYLKKLSETMTTKIQQKIYCKIFKMDIGMFNPKTRLVIGK
uniref:DNA repair exonuclease n=1 Tax=Pithovirus LCPAC001 TaxID=2506585 RepID=A0A481Z1M4_9VIRU|nr:MAG: DNA repair exonuclease [Pithovirus LCPAC001]